MEMTTKQLRKLCLDHDLYSTPHLNDLLYLHHQGFEKIENLDEYKNVKAMFLQSNAISEIENLHHCKKLRSLIMENNCISEITNLEFASELDTLNLNNNMLTDISGLSKCIKLQTLSVKKNQIRTYENLKGLLECPSITNLDLTGNRIEDPKCLEVIHQMSNLRVLYMKDNPILNKANQYRKTMICKCKNLKYLDDRPVFDDERRLAEAWLKNGREGERIERAKIKDEKLAKQNRRMQSFQEMLDNARRNDGNGDDDGIDEEVSSSDSGKNENMDVIKDDKHIKINANEEQNENLPPIRNCAKSTR
eukprot:UN24090